MNEYQQNPERFAEGTTAPFSEKSETFPGENTVPAAENTAAVYNAPYFTHSALGSYTVPGAAPVPGNTAYSPVYVPVPPAYDLRDMFFKECVHKVGNAIGLPLCIFFFVNIAFRFVEEIISRLIFGDPYAISRDTLLSLAVSSAVSMLVMTLPYLITGKKTGHRLGDTVALGKFDISLLIPLSMLGLGVCAVGNYASSVISSLLDQFTGGSFSTASEPVGTAEILTSILCIAVVPAVVEEFAFRGVVLGTLRKYTSDGMAVFISAAAFGLIHGNLEQTPFAFCAGLALGYAAVRSGSIIPGIIIHFLNNASSVLLSAAGTVMSPAVESVVYLSHFIFTLLLGICGYLLISKRDRSPFRFSSHDTGDSKKFLSSFCSSGWIVTFIVFCCAEIVLAQLIAMGMHILL